MHGLNEVAKFIDKPEAVDYQVHEIWLTCQGEGPRAGQRAVFIRLTKCHLRCTWCDTEWNDRTDPHLSIADIMLQVKSLWGTLPDPLVVLTGGEPTRQPIDSLARALVTWGAMVQIETAGTFYRDCMSWGPDLHNPYVQTVVSPKTPHVDPRVAANATAYKYIISASDEHCPETGVPITATQRGARPARLALPISPRDKVYLSPCDEEDPVKNAANLQRAAELALQFGYTLGVQIHKLVGLR